jgi:hypothetical protein
LIFRKIKSFVDGRTDQLFLGGFFDHVNVVVLRHPRNFLTFLAEYSITLALVVPDSLESQELQASGTWEKVYADKVSELYRKGG